MFLHQSVLGCLLLTITVCLAENGGTRVTTAGGVTLKPLLVGLSAVVGFLFLIFVLLMVKRLFFTEHWTKVEDREKNKLYDECGEEPEKDKQTSL